MGFSFYRYETAVIPIVLSDKDALKEYETVVVSIAQRGRETRQFSETLGIDPDEGRINVPLSQEDTAAFAAGIATVQVNIYYQNTERDVSARANIEVLGNLLEEVMP